MNTTIERDTPRLVSPNTAALRMLLSFLVAMVLTAILLFGGAGRLNWTAGWVFLGVWIAPKLCCLLLLRLRDPVLLVERATRHRNTPHYDRVIMSVYFVLAFGTFLIASLDGGRFHWSGPVPSWLVVLAYVVYLLGNVLAGLAMLSNPYHSAESRLQMDRGQEVVSSGPYRMVRHPTYLASVLLWPVTGLMLASWWAVIPGILTALTMVIRTLYEDRMLHAELPGYTEYALFRFRTTRTRR